nr:unnamed protein product [Naegleria fowleri]
MLHQVSQPKQAFVAIHDENHLLSELSSSPMSGSSSSMIAHSGSGGDSEASSSLTTNKLLEKVSKVDPHYVPHLQNHKHHHHHEKHLSNEHHESHPLGTATYYTPQILTDEEDDEEEAMLSQHHHDIENGKVSSSRYQTQEIESFHQERKKYITRKLFENFSLRDLIVKWRYSIIYSLYLLIMSGLAAFLFAWAIYKRGKIEEIWFLALEGFCTFAIVYECFLSIFLYRRHWYKRIIVWCNIFVSLAALVIFSLLLYCFIENQENYFWSNVAFAEEVIIGIHCTVNALRIIIYILQIRRGRTIMTNNPIFLDTSTPTSTSDQQNHLTNEKEEDLPEQTSSQTSYGTVSNAN